MGDFAHLHTDDVTGLATAGDIVLVDISGGAKRDFVEMLSEKGIYIPAAAKSIKPVEEYQISWELRSSDLEIPLGALVNTSYLFTALSVSCDSGKYPTVNGTVIKFSNDNKFIAALSAGTVGGALSETISGGFGLVNKFGVTGTIRGLSSSMSISMQAAERMEEESGDYLQDGYVQYGFKKEVTIESYTQVNESTGLPSGAVWTNRPTKTSREGFKIFTTDFFLYLGT